MTEYVVHIIGDPARWAAMEPAEIGAAYAEFGRFDAELNRRGHRITAAAQLHPAHEGKHIPAGGGTVTDGPFAETAEQVGGYYQIATDDLDDLLECCQIVAAVGEGIEVRQVVARDQPPS